MNDDLISRQELLMKIPIALIVCDKKCSNRDAVIKLAELASAIRNATAYILTSTDDKNAQGGTQ